MRALHFIMGATRKTTHTDGLEATISGRPDAQHGIKFRAMTAEPRPIIDNRAIPFKRDTVQKTGCGTGCAKFVLKIGKRAQFDQFSRIDGEPLTG
jgi:hypothetical protein